MNVSDKVCGAKYAGGPQKAAPNSKESLDGDLSSQISERFDSQGINDDLEDRLLQTFAKEQSTSQPGPGLHLNVLEAAIACVVVGGAITAGAAIAGGVGASVAALVMGFTLFAPGNSSPLDTGCG